MRLHTLSLLSLLPLFACDCGEGLLNVNALLVVETQSVDFGEVAVGGLRIRSVILRNDGVGQLNITRFELASEGTEIQSATAIPDVIAPGGRLEFNLVYMPVDVGEDTAVLLVQGDDQGGELQRVDIRGEGVTGSLEITHPGDACAGAPNSIDFGQTEPGSTSERTITISAIGSSDVTILSAVREPSSSGEFEIDGPQSPVTLASGETLELTARYRPADGGPDSGAFVITTDAPESPSITIPVCGVAVAPALCGRPVPLDFGAVPTGATVTATLTLESCGLLPVDLTSVGIEGDADFSIAMAPSVPQTLDPGQTAQVAVQISPSSLGRKQAEVVTMSSTFGQPQQRFEVIANVAVPCDLIVAPSSIVFPAVAAGATERRNALIANAGAASCDVTNVEITSGAQFSIASAPALPFALGPGANELVAIEYAPTSTTPAMGTLSVEAGGQTESVDLFGNPPEVEGCAVALSPSVIQFGAAAVGTVVRRAVEVTATGEDACRIRSVSLLLGSPEFSSTTPVPGLVLPIGSTDVSVAYEPTSAGSHFDVLEIEVSRAFGGGNSTFHQVAVFGAAADSRICVNPIEIDFGTVAIGNPVSRTVDIQSCGGADLQLQGVLLAPGGAADFSLSQRPPLPQMIPTGQAAAPVLTVDYTPSSAGPHFGQIDVLSSDVNSPIVSVRLSGNWDGACTQVLDCNPVSIDFGPTDVGVTKVRSVLCRNAASDPVTIASAALTGSPELSLMATVPTTLAPGDVWAAEVRFDPTMAGAASAMLNLSSDACIAPSPIAVAGTGQVPMTPPCVAPTTFSPVVEWEWHGSTIEPDFNNVWMTPLVANLTDDNNDGRVDENDIPDVIFSTFDSVPISDPTQSRPGVLRVVSGDTGLEHFSVTDVRFAESAQLAVGDINADGFPEIIGSLWVETPPGTGAGGFQGRYVEGRLVALDRFGNVLWISDPWSWPPLVLWNAAAPYLADLDGDGFSEIIFGREVFDSQGRRLWRGAEHHGLTSGGPQSIAVDIDLDGSPEVIAGGTAYRANGTVFWTNSNIGEGGASVGMLDPNDPFPQIAIDTGPSLHVVDHMGQIVWSDSFANREPTASLPVIADFDGDGDADVAVADGALMRVYTGQGAPIFTAPVFDSTCCAGISAFDFEGDSGFELLLHDFGNIYAFRGNTGAQVYSAPRLNPTNLEIPVVADIDNDRRAEVVVALYDELGNGGGVIAYSNTGNSWVTAPRIWNQQAYHVINVTESGAIPRVPTPIPQAPPVFRATVPSCE